jgi:hypothetical protein
VLDARAHEGRIDLIVDIDGVHARAIAYPDITGPVVAGDEVICNTTAVELGLGTGGAHFVMAVRDPAPQPVAPPPGHAMKLRYTPSQTAVLAVEESHREQLDALDSLDGMPVVVAGLHSALAPAATGARFANPGGRIVYVMTDGGALHARFSDTLGALRAHGLLDATITAGQSTGGDYEAVTLYGALAAARAVLNAGAVIVAMGPGNLGTGSRWGAALLEVAHIVDAAAAMGARPILAPRLSFADARARHRGVSHHTLTALRLAYARAEVVLPPLAGARMKLVGEQLEPFASKHDVVFASMPAELERALEDSPVPLSTMGRSYGEDPDYFRAAAAAGARATWKR